MNLDRYMPSDWNSNRDGWFRALSAALTREGFELSVEHHNPTAEVPVRHSALLAQGLSGCVALCMEPTGPTLALAGGASPGDAAVWRTVLDDAAKRFSTRHRFRWYVVVGEAPAAVTHLQYVRASFTVGDIEVRPLGYVFHEQYSVRRRVHSHPFTSLPALMSGELEALDSTDAEYLAYEPAVQLCALLSVWWNSRWALRTGVVDTPEVPLPPSAPARFAPGGVTEQMMVDALTPMNPPASSELDYEYVRADAHVGAALNAYHQGLLMVDDHPSYALVAFVACIETLGIALHDLARCDKCGGQSGSAERFRRALGSVLPDEGATRLAKLYRPRSTTVHAAEFHGGEEFAGQYRPPGPFDADSAVTFASHLERLRVAARSLLLKRLGSTQRRGPRALFGTVGPAPEQTQLNIPLP